MSEEQGQKEVGNSEPEVVLSPRHALFALEYTRDYNGNLAAIRAGYARAGARVEASRLLTNPNIKAEIERLQAENATRIKIDLDRLDEELKRIAVFDPKNLFDADGSQIPIQDLDESVTAAIAGLEFVDYYEEKVQQGILRKWKTHDKLKAMELLLKRRGALTEKVEIIGDKSTIKALVESVAREMKPDQFDAWLAKAEESIDLGT